MRQNVVKILGRLKFFVIFWVCASVPSLSVAEDIVTSASKCSDAVQKHADMTPRAGSEEVDVGWFTDVVTWSENSIECEVKLGDVVSLRIGDRIYVVDGFAGAAAKAAFAQMEANLDNAEETMDATVRDLKVALENYYKPMLVEPSPDVVRIQEEFAEEISRATGALYRGFYADNHERIALLDEIEQSGDEEALALHLVKLRKELDEANSKNEEVTAWASQLQDKISNLEQKVSEQEHELSEFTRMKLEANLEKDLAMIEAYIQNLEFYNASDKIRGLEQKGLLEQSARDKLEALALSTVRPLPASEADLNKAGYQLLQELNRDSEEYRAKVARYSALAPGTYWVADSEAVQPGLYTCPSASCGRVGKVYDGNKLTVFEARNGFARVTDYYPVMCSGGRMSDDVDDGLDVCTAENGVRNGMIARWVKASFLVSEKPVKAKPMSDAENWVSGSTDFSTYREAFGDAAQRLVDRGECTPQDFTEMGGWTASDLGAGNYFIWCKNLTVKHYLDAKTGRLR